MKQETPEEAAENYAIDKQNENASKYYIALESFQEGAKWQQERSYSEEEVYNLLLKHQSDYRSHVRNSNDWSFNITKWFEQFKKK